MDNVVRGKFGFVDEFTTFAQEALDAFRERGAEFEGSMTKLMSETKAFGEKFGEGSKFGSYIQKNPSRAALFSFMTGLMFTQHMKNKGMNFSSDVPEMKKTGRMSKPKSRKAKAA